MRITANQVTIARLIAMPFIAALAYGDEQMRIFAVILGTLIGLTDTVDGYLARKHGVTVLGSLLEAKFHQRWRGSGKRSPASSTKRHALSARTRAR